MPKQDETKFICMLAIVIINSLICLHGKPTDFKFLSDKQGISLYDIHHKVISSSAFIIFSFSVFVKALFLMRFQNRTFSPVI